MKGQFMTNDTLIYHPPRREPSFFNEWLLWGMFTGLITGGGSLAVTTSFTAINGIIGGTFGYMASVATAAHMAFHGVGF
jgi:hypothetical protein